MLLYGGVPRGVRVRGTPARGRRDPAGGGVVVLGVPVVACVFAGRPLGSVRIGARRVCSVLGGMEVSRVGPCPAASRGGRAGPCPQPLPAAAGPF